MDGCTSGFRARFKGFALSSRHFRGSVAHGAQVSSVALGNGKLFMRRAPDIFGVHALRVTHRCVAQGRARAAGIRVGGCSSSFCWDSGTGRDLCLAVVDVEFSLVHRRRVQDQKTTRLAVCVSHRLQSLRYALLARRALRSRNEIMTSSITKDVTFSGTGISSIASKSHRFSPFFANPLSSQV